MSSSSLSSDASSSRRGLRWWQWLLFILPGIVAVGYTSAHFAMYPADRAGSGSPYNPLLTGPGLTGLVSGGVLCIVAGIVLGITTRPGRAASAAIGWTLLSLLTNLPITIAGYSILYLTMLR